MAITLKTIGLAIMKARQNLGWTQEDLAGEAEVTRAYLSKVENGHVSFSVEVLLRLAKALNMDPAKLLK